MNHISEAERLQRERVSHIPEMVDMYAAVDRMHQDSHNRHKEGSIHNCNGSCVFRRASAGAQ